MPGRKAARLLVGLSAAMAVLGMAVTAEAQEKKITVGVIYDLTGPLAGGGSELQYGVDDSDSDSDEETPAFLRMMRAG